VDSSLFLCFHQINPFNKRMEAKQKRMVQEKIYEISLLMDEVSER